ncbi:MAG TPA: NlpC/P60 family protein [Negativicutes bacterium]|nr:NlpC/P60 family protein [Negativicutes bacterium]
MKKCLFLLLVACIFISTGVACAGGLVPGTPEYEASLLQDMEYRKSLPQTEVPHAEWYTQRMLASEWGPMPARYPGIEKLVEELPHGTDVVQWKRDRVVAVAKHYIGLPYRHHHIPAWSPIVTERSDLSGPGMDCSNFTSWVYNFGFGLLLNGDVVKQSKMEPRAGFSLPGGMRRIDADGPFMPGDLLYISDPKHTVVVHTVIFIDDEHIIDSTDGHVAIRHFTGWYRARLSHAIRIFH